MSYLKEKGVKPVVYNYQKEQIDPEELAEIIRISDQPLQDFVRTNEVEYKALGLKGREINETEFA